MRTHEQIVSSKGHTRVTRRLYLPRIARRHILPDFCEREKTNESQGIHTADVLVLFDRLECECAESVHSSPDLKTLEECTSSQYLSIVAMLRVEALVLTACSPRCMAALKHNFLTPSARSRDLSMIVLYRF